MNNNNSNQNNNIIYNETKIPSDNNNLNNNNDKSKKILKIGILVLIVLILGFPRYKKIFSNLINDNNKKVEIKNNILLNTDDIEIEVKSVSYEIYYILVRFNLNNKSNEYYNFNVYKLKVNDYEDMHFAKISGSNISVMNKYVDPHKNSSDYVLYIGYDELKKQNIDKYKINKLGFKLLIYKSEDGKTSNGYKKIDNYLDIELK